MSAVSSTTSPLQQLTGAAKWAWGYMPNRQQAVELLWGGAALGLDLYLGGGGLMALGAMGARTVTNLVNPNTSPVVQELEESEDQLPEPSTAVQKKPTFTQTVAAITPSRQTVAKAAFLGTIYCFDELTGSHLFPAILAGEAGRRYLDWQAPTSSPRIEVMEDDNAEKRKATRKAVSWEIDTRGWNEAGQSSADVQTAPRKAQEVTTSMIPTRELSQSQPSIKRTQQQPPLAAFSSSLRRDAQMPFVNHTTALPPSIFPASRQVRPQSPSISRATQQLPPLSHRVYTQSQQPSMSRANQQTSRGTLGMEERSWNSLSRDEQWAAIRRQVWQ